MATAAAFVETTVRWVSLRQNREKGGPINFYTSILLTFRRDSSFNYTVLIRLESVTDRQTEGRLGHG